MEVFGMTRWFSAESTLENYQSIGNALLMLAFMSTGLVFYYFTCFASDICY